MYKYPYNYFRNTFKIKFLNKNNHLTKVCQLIYLIYITMRKAIGEGLSKRRNLCAGLHHQK